MLGVTCNPLFGKIFRTQVPDPIFISRQLGLRSYNINDFATVSLSCSTGQTLEYSEAEDKVIVKSLGTLSHILLASHELLSPAALEMKFICV